MAALGALFGVMAGALVVVPAFSLIIPNPAVLGSDEWPAPSCLVWAGVSKAFANGVGGLHISAQTAIIAGESLMGIVVALLVVAGVFSK